MAFSFASNLEELLLRDCCQRSHKLNMSSQENLMPVLHDNPGYQETHRGNDPKVRVLHSCSVVAIYSGSGTINRKENYDIAQVLRIIRESWNLLCECL